ncbi:hypothetical protein DOTSEDRAFT_24831 [Dothistroma septosporum NZE10]|uniref:Uncharacterized protein n=1 Tax=Dothistroma septosporum (strain NZE10 / CBS 128990) TaxID=675120 RepID=M2WLB4_DOTSN|nr:hypothetical protein DOTSEDRAFT_24831 [Dothistroma septosporum NZE10]
MVPHPEVSERRDSTNPWMPPKRLGSNVKVELRGAPLTFVFQHDGTSTGQIQDLPTRCDLHQTHSLYHARGNIWIVDYDATESTVGDGLDSGNAASVSQETLSTVDGTDDPRYENWNELSFDRRDIDNATLSFADLRQEHLRLPMQRHDQSWVQHYLPLKYHASEWSADPKSGGLVGRLSVLLGLVAMLQSSETWPQLLPKAIDKTGLTRGFWQVPQRQLSQRECGMHRTDERGLVITVYFDPDLCSKKDLSDLENGRKGPILP